MSRQYGSLEIPFTVMKQWEPISLLLVALKNIAAVFWLYWLAGKDKTNKFTWTVFGLCFGLLAVAIYYLARINDRIGT